MDSSALPIWRPPTTSLTRMQHHIGTTALDGIALPVSTRERPQRTDASSSSCSGLPTASSMHRFGCRFALSMDAFYPGCFRECSIVRHTGSINWSINCTPFSCPCCWFGCHQLRCDVRSSPNRKNNERDANLCQKVYKYHCELWAPTPTHLEAGSIDVVPSKTFNRKRVGVRKKGG